MHSPDDRACDSQETPSSELQNDEDASSFFSGSLLAGEDDLAKLPVFAPLRVLVADDIGSNRALAAGLLEYRGHACRLAVNGKQAVQMFQEGSFDAVLMDLEMPEMDGIAAAIAIRASRGGRDVPIIAMTTRVADGLEKQCVDAGMTAFVPKPFSPRDMVIILEQAVARVRLARIARLLHVLPESESMKLPLASPSPTSSVVDLNVARQRLGNDEQLLREMAGFFIEDVPALVAELRGALANRDVELVTRSAHSIKGLSSNFDANSAVRVALAIEDAARRGDLTAAGAGVDELDQELDRVICALKTDVLAH